MIRQIFQQAKQKLANPTKAASTNTLTAINLCYIILVLFYLFTEKITTGEFVHNPIMWLIYSLTLVINGISWVINFKVILQLRINPSYEYHETSLAKTFRYATILSLLALSFAATSGISNPNVDSVLVGYGFACSLILITMIVLNSTKYGLIWLIICFSSLFYHINNLGWDYQLQFQTNAEAAKYNSALKNNEDWAVDRQATLVKEGHKPAHVSRYFIVWTIYLFVAFLSGFFFLQASSKLNSNLPEIFESFQTMESNQEGIRTKFNSTVKELNNVTNTMNELSGQLDRFTTVTVQEINSHLYRVKGLLNLIKHDNRTDQEVVEQFSVFVRDLENTVHGIRQLTVSTNPVEDYGEVNYQTILDSLKEEISLPINFDVHLLKPAFEYPDRLRFLLYNICASGVIAVNNSHIKQTLNLTVVSSLIDMNYYEIILQWREDPKINSSIDGKRFMSTELKSSKESNLYMAITLANKMKGKLTFEGSEEFIKRIIVKLPYQL